MRRNPINNLESHPNVGEIVEVLSLVAHITDDELVRLATCWRNPVTVAEARHRALTPDSPLILEVLTAFDAVSSLYADDLAGADYTDLDERTVALGLKAVRDAIAGAYARPILSRGEHNALMHPWRSTFPAGTDVRRDLGPTTARVNQLVSALPRISTRCHDERAGALFDELLGSTYSVDSHDHEDALDVAWSAAILTGRRRLWTLVRRTGTEAFTRRCPRCGARRLDDDGLRVLGMCLDAVCGLLVDDVLEDAERTALIHPVAALLPLQRKPSE